MQPLCQMQVVEVLAAACGKVRHNKMRLCSLRGLLSLVTAPFVIVAADQNLRVRELFSHGSRHNRQIPGRKRHIDRPCTGKVNAGPGGVAFTKCQRFFCIAGNNELPVLNLAARKKSLSAVRCDILQTLHRAGTAPDRNDEHPVSVLTHIRKRRNTFAAQVRVPF